MLRVDPGVHDGDGDVGGVLEPGGRPRVAQTIAPCPQSREASGSAFSLARRPPTPCARAAQTRTPTSFIRATCAASWAALVPLLTLSSTRRGARAPAIAVRPPAPAAANIDSERVPRARALVEDVGDAGDVRVVQQSGQRRVRRHACRTCGTPARRQRRRRYAGGPPASAFTLAMTVCSDFFGGSTSCSQDGPAQAFSPYCLTCCCPASPAAGVSGVRATAPGSGTPPSAPGGTARQRP